MAMETWTGRILCGARLAERQDAGHGERPGWRSLDRHNRCGHAAGRRESGGGISIPRCEAGIPRPKNAWRSRRRSLGGARGPRHCTYNLPPSTCRPASRSLLCRSLYANCVRRRKSQQPALRDAPTISLVRFLMQWATSALALLHRLMFTGSLPQSNKHLTDGRHTDAAMKVSCRDRTRRHLPDELQRELNLARSGRGGSDDARRRNRGSVGCK